MGSNPAGRTIFPLASPAFPVAKSNELGWLPHHDGLKPAASDQLQIAVALIRTTAAETQSARSWPSLLIASRP
ncbi:MAG: hypothetical protein RR784_02975, partial [Burkholderiaceae bacterium]